MGGTSGLATESVGDGMTYLGDFALGSTFDCKFCTVNTSGVPTQLAGTPVISAYPDNSTTQLTAGITLTVDFDAVTGLNNVRVVATSGNGYAAGSNYQLVITTGTVSGSSVVGYVVGQFSIEARSGLRPTTAGRTLDVSSGGEAGLDWANVGSATTVVNLSGTTVKTATDVETDTADIQTRLPAALAGGRMDSSVGAYQTGLTPLQPTVAGRTLDVSLTGEAGVDWANVGSPTTANNLSGTTVGTVTTLTGHTPQTGDNFARLGAPAGASVSADVAAVKADSAAILDDTGTSGVAISATTQGAIADKMLGRNLATGSDGTRTVQDALRTLRNKTALAAGTLTVYQEDDTTAAWTATVTTGTRDPVNTVDPA